MRNTEIVADATNALALHVAALRKRDVGNCSFECEALAEHLDD